MKTSIFLLIVITIIIVIISSYKLFVPKKAISLIKINGIGITVQIAKSSKEIEKGLGGRSNLGEKDGMLFIMPSYDRYTFWMKDMKFPLDIIWVDNDTIVDITKNIPAESSNHFTIYQPTKPVNLVLEVNAGFSDKYRIKVGDKLQ